MKSLKRLATGHPISFGLVVSLMVLLCYIAAAVVGEMVADDRAGYELAEAIGRAAVSLLFLYMLRRFGWLESSGVTRKGSHHAWVIVLVVLVYDLVTTAHALFGSMGMSGVSDPVLTAAVATNALTTGLLEEIPFRGLILYACFLTWGDSGRGVIKGVLYSSLLFGGSHLIHILLGRPIPQAILVAAATFLSGIFHAGFVLRWKTIWTVVVLHGVANAVVAMRVLENPGFVETVPALGLMIVLQLPLAVYGATLICRVRPQLPVPDTAVGGTQEVAG